MAVLTRRLNFRTLAAVQLSPAMKPLLPVCFRLAVVACVFFSLEPLGAAAAEPTRQIGVAAVDITPAYPIRLSGYAARKTEATNAIHKLWTKALAIGSDKEGPSILITVDNTGVPKHVRDEVVARLAKKKIDPNRIAVCSTHSHTAHASARRCCPR